MIDYKFCPQCRKPLLPLNEHLECKDCGAKIYLDPKPCTGALILKDGKILLSIRGIEPFRGTYDVPGGFLKAGESGEQGAIREIKEETGLDIEIVDYLASYADTYGNDGDPQIVLHYIGKITGGKLKAQDDVVALEWWPIEKLPKNIGFKNVRLALKRLQKWYREKNDR